MQILHRPLSSGLNSNTDKHYSLLKRLTVRDLTDLANHQEQQFTLTLLSYAHDQGVEINTEHIYNCGDTLECDRKTIQTSLEGAETLFGSFQNH